MITIEKKNLDGGGLLISLVGYVDADLDLEKGVGEVPSKKLTVNTSQVTGMNSAGVIPWLRYFDRVRSEGVQLRFVECSLTITNYINMLSNFVRSDEVISVMAPFFCDKCSAEITELVTTSSLEQVEAQISSKTCATCKSPLVLDEHPEEFVAFLKRRVSY